MYIDPGWTVDDIVSLRAALRTGILTVEYDGPPKRLVTYQSIGAMRALLAEMVSTVNKTDGGSSYRLAATRKGLG